VTGQVIHQRHHDGSTSHIDFTCPMWERSMKDPSVASRWTHSPSACAEIAPSKAAEPLPPMVLVDVMNLAFRSHFAAPNLHDEEGRPTSVLHGFLRALLPILAASGDAAVFCWDGGVPGDRPRTPWRKVIYPEYKANRQPSDDAEMVRAQLPELHRALCILGFPSVGVPGLEADDLIAILSRPRSIIYSSDRDLYQLIGDTCRVMRPRKEGGWREVAIMEVLAERRKFFAGVKT
jgi:5'-3' exonuclease